MSKRVQYRQGDVLLTKIARLPKKGTPVERDNGRIILAYGEVTGHAHELKSKSAQLLTIDLNEGPATYLTLDEIAPLVHEEHGTILVEKGTYKVTKQVEYTPESIRNVAD
jgi:hypothetical protein